MPFTPSIREQLANEVGAKCSANHCRKPTGSPSNAKFGLPNVGDAAHIKGSRPNTARYDEKQHEEERESAGNGIWLCPDCHRRADRFENVYDVALLNYWKVSAIQRHIDEVSGVPPLHGQPDPHQELWRARQFALLLDQLFLLLQQFRWHAYQVPFMSTPLELPSEAETLIRIYGFRFRQIEWHNGHSAWSYRPDVHAKEDELLRLCYAMALDPRIMNFETSVFVNVDRVEQPDGYVDPLMRTISCFVDEYREFVAFVDKM